MNSTDVIDVLQRLLRVLSRSLAMYLDEAKPWVHADDQQTAAALERLAADRRLYCDRVSRAIVELGGRPDPGRFSGKFIGLNDLDLAYLTDRLIRSQRADVTAMKACVADLAEAPTWRELAEEALGNTQGHLEEITKHE